MAFPGPINILKVSVASLEMIKFMFQAVTLLEECVCEGCADSAFWLSGLFYELKKNIRKLPVAYKTEVY